MNVVAPARPARPDVVQPGEDRARVAPETFGEEVALGGEQLGQLGAYERVAGAQVGQEGQRLVAAHRAQPQREAGQLDGHRVEIDAVETALGHQPLDVGQRQFPVVGGVGGDVLGDVGRRGDEEVPAAHGGIQDAQLEE